MNNKLKIAFALCLSLPLLFCGCEEHCSAFPDSQMVWFPASTEGSAVEYSNGSQSIRLLLKTIEKNDKYSFSKDCDCMCEYFAYEYFASSGLDLYYSVNIYGDIVSMSIILSDGSGEDRYGFKYNVSKNSYEYGPERIGSLTVNGKTYSDVIRLKKRSGESDDLIYYSYGSGVIRFERGEVVWDLVE